MMHKKARTQFAEDKQTKNVDYWNHVLWSDETKIHLFGSDDVKRVWCNKVRSTKTSVSCLQSSMSRHWGATVHWGNHECQHVL